MWSTIVAVPVLFVLVALVSIAHPTLLILDALSCPIRECGGGRQELFEGFLRLIMQCGIAYIVYRLWILILQWMPEVGDTPSELRQSARFMAGFAVVIVSFIIAEYDSKPHSERISSLHLKDLCCAVWKCVLWTFSMLFGALCGACGILITPIALYGVWFKLAVTQANRWFASDPQFSSHVAWSCVLAIVGPVVMTALLYRLAHWEGKKNGTPLPPRQEAITNMIAPIVCSGFALVFFDMFFSPYRYARWMM